MKFSELQAIHQKLLAKSLMESIDRAELVSEVSNYINLAKKEAQYIYNSGERENLRANLRYWASFVHEITHDYPNIELPPIAPNSNFLSANKIYVTLSIVFLLICSVYFLGGKYIQTTLPLFETPAPTPVSSIILRGGIISQGFNIGVNTSNGLTDWVDSNQKEICMSYPGELWGAVFITVGQPTPPRNRPGKDFSSYKTLSLDLKSAKGDQYVLIGLKDNNDPDDGSENKFKLNISPDYKTYSIPLSTFSADLKKLYVVTEFVFETAPGTICVNKIQFLP